MIKRRSVRQGFVHKEAKPKYDRKQGGWSWQRPYLGRMSRGESSVHRTCIHSFASNRKSIKFVLTRYYQSCLRESLRWR